MTGLRARGLAVCSLVLGSTATLASEDENEFGQLVDAPGVETTYYTCVACHSEMIIAQQGLSRAHWDELLDWMVEEQGMAELDEKDRNEILDYLATHYNEDRPNFPQKSE
ncbi:MAG: aldehyde dehydrogenase [Pseudomonadota bacterium]